MCDIPDNGKFYCRIWINNAEYKDFTYKTFMGWRKIIPTPHRTTGPSIEYARGDFIYEINGVNISYWVNKWFKEMGWVPEDHLNTKEKQILFKLKFC